MIRTKNNNKSTDLKGMDMIYWSDKKMMLVCEKAPKSLFMDGLTITSIKNMIW